MNKKELMRLLDKYEIEYEITDNTKEVEEGLRLLDEALEKIGIIIPKETQVDTITTENDTEVSKYTTEWASSDDCISRQAVLDFPIRLDHYDRENGNRHFVLGIESVMEYVELLPAVEPPKKVVAQIKVDTDELIEQIKEEHEIKDRPVCEDTISRQAAIDIIEGYPHGDWNLETMNDMVSMVRQLPPAKVEPERPKGEWIKSYFNECCGTDENHNLVFRKTPCVRCDQCGEKRRNEEKFCPNCGADMRGDKE